MNKKGFTLVELLAVIVILAIIALIAIPLIGNVIEKAKIGALESSVNGLVESANMYYANNIIKGETVTETIFDFEEGEQISTQKLEYKGKVYNGKLILHANGEVAVCIDDEEHYAYKNKDADEIVSGLGTCLYDGTTGDFSSNSPVEDLKQQIAAATATADKVLEGNTIYTSVGLVAGTMTNYSTKTVNATTVTESGENALITIPNSGYYDETSQISVPIETIKNEVASLSSGLLSATFSKSKSFTAPTTTNAYVVLEGYFTVGTNSDPDGYVDVYLELYDTANPSVALLKIMCRGNGDNNLYKSTSGIISVIEGHTYSTRTYKNENTYGASWSITNYGAYGAY